MHATDIVAYTYQAETLCPGCTLDALNVPAGLRAEQSCESILETLAVAQGIDCRDLRSFDSGDFPKVVFADQVLTGHTFNNGGYSCDICDDDIDKLESESCVERCGQCGEELL